jgi:predicted nuclease of predicted toxin-antitoxin system
MSLSILIDMNLSPDWVAFLGKHGWSAVHWSKVGDPRASDREIMDWALANGCLVFTHDLDFGMILALTRMAGPSVLQVRSQDVLPDRIGNLVVAALRQHEAALKTGALVVVDAKRSRARSLPL